MLNALLNDNPGITIFGFKIYAYALCIVSGMIAAFFLISLLCTDIAESFGAKMEVTEPMALCVRVLANRCNGIVDTIIAEEDAAEVQNY